LASLKAAEAVASSSSLVYFTAHDGSPMLECVQTLTQDATLIERVRFRREEAAN
jgi:hypothetical protein